MAVTLRDILSLDAVRAADPVVIHGVHQLDRTVRWVHTSELAEAAALLRGGELLLTTGLGLAGRGPVAQAMYVDELANRSVAALGLELGWSFSEVPEALRAAAVRRDLPLLALRSLVPFVEITEAVQAQILTAELTSLRAERNARAVLDEALARRAGLGDLVTAIAGYVDGPVAIESADGRVVALDGLSPWAASHLQQHAGTTTAIVVDGAVWGWLHVLHAPSTKRERVAAIRQHGVAAVALVLVRDHADGSLRASLARELLDDLVGERLTKPAEVIARTDLVEPAFASARNVAAVAVADLGPDVLAVAFYALSIALVELGPAIVATVDGTVVALVAHPSTDAEGLARRLHARVAGILRLRGTPEVPTLATAIVAPGLVGVGRTLADARTTAALLADLGTDQRMGSVDSLIAVRLVDRLVDDREAQHLVATHLGAVLRYDEQHGTELVRTLASYLSTGVSKTELADRLQLRRQTLYKRLAKIEELIGRIDDPARRTSLLLALQVHELRRARHRPGSIPGQTSGGA